MDVSSWVYISFSSPVRSALRADLKATKIYQENDIRNAIANTCLQRKVTPFENLFSADREFLLHHDFIDADWEDEDSIEEWFDVAVGLKTVDAIIDSYCRNPEKYSRKQLAEFMNSIREELIDAQKAGAKFHLNFNPLVY